jgi:hypothetical protein
MDFEGFLSVATEHGWASLQRDGEGKLVSEGMPAIAKALFESYRASIETINNNEDLFVRGLVEQATKEGHYVEEEDTGPRHADLEEPSEVKAFFLKILENGKRRVFRLGADGHPEFEEFEKIRDRSLRSFLVSLSTIKEE